MDECQAIGSARSMTTTLIGCVNALGHSLSKFLPFLGQQCINDCMSGCNFYANDVISAFKQSDILELSRRPRPCATDNQPIFIIHVRLFDVYSSLLISWDRRKNIIILPAPTFHVVQIPNVVFGPV